MLDQVGPARDVHERDAVAGRRVEQMIVQVVDRCDDRRRALGQRVDRVRAADVEGDGTSVAEPIGQGHAARRGAAAEQQRELRVAFAQERGYLRADDAVAARDGHGCVHAITIG